MRITFTQSGGIVGLIKTCTIDTATLAYADRREVEALIVASGFAASAELVSPNARDCRQYEITIEGETAPTRFLCDEASLPASARPLVAFLSARAQPESPGHGVGPS